MGEDRNSAGMRKREAKKSDWKQHFFFDEQSFYGEEGEKKEKEDGGEGKKEKKRRWRFLVEKMNER